MDRENEDIPFKELLEVMRTLRGTKGCAWNKKQTLQSLKIYLLEEAP